MLIIILLGIIFFAWLYFGLMPETELQDKESAEKVETTEKVDVKIKAQEELNKQIEKELAEQGKLSSETRQQIADVANKYYNSEEQAMIEEEEQALKEKRQMRKNIIEEANK